MQRRLHSSRQRQQQQQQHPAHNRDRDNTPEHAIAVLLPLQRAVSYLLFATRRSAYYIMPIYRARTPPTISCKRQFLSVLGARVGVGDLRGTHAETARHQARACSTVQPRRCGMRRDYQHISIHQNVRYVALMLFCRALCRV